MERCILLPFLFSLSLPSWGTLEPLFCLPSLPFSRHNQPADRQTRAVIDDALSESDNIFSRSLKRDRAASVVGRSWPPLSVCEVHLLCSVTPLTTPISAALGLCKLELTTPPRLLEICTADMPQHLTRLQLCAFSSPPPSPRRYGSGREGIVCIKNIIKKIPRL